jgi:hypothetical protein
MLNIIAIVFAASMGIGTAANVMVYSYQTEDGTQITKQPSFINRYGKIITRFGNILILSWIGFLFYINLLIPVDTLHKAMIEKQQISNFAVRSIISMFLSSMIWSVSAGIATASFLTIFLSKITKAKRIFLLIICLLPPAFAGALLLLQPEFDAWLIIQIGLLATFTAWLMNGTTIIFGKHFLTFAGIATNKLLTKMQKKKPSGP